MSACDKVIQVDDEIKLHDFSYSNTYIYKTHLESEKEFCSLIKELLLRERDKNPVIIHDHFLQKEFPVIILRIVYCEVILLMTSGIIGICMLCKARWQSSMKDYFIMLQNLTIEI